MKHKYGKRYEYKCPHCGEVNIRYEECARIVCDKCGKEFIPSDVEKETKINVDWIKSVTVTIPKPDEYYSQSYDSNPPWLKNKSLTYEEVFPRYIEPKTTDGWLSSFIKLWDNPIDDLWNGV